MKKLEVPTKKYFILGLVLLGIGALAFQSSPYARRIRPFASTPVSCVENEIGYNMTSHKLYICKNTGYTEVGGGGGGGISNSAGNTIITMSDGTNVVASYLTNASNAVFPTTDDNAALGNTTHNFSDLFLASGAVINYANGNVVLTQTSGILTLGTGDLRITTAGTNAASVVTLNGTQTLANKTLTTPVLGVATATSINGLILSSSTGTFSLTNGKTFSVTNALTLGGTDSTVMTFPGATDTIAGLGAIQTFTAAKTFNAAKLIIGTNSGAPSIVANALYRDTGDNKLYIGNVAGNAYDEIFEAGVSLVNLTSNVTGTLLVANGGTGITSFGTGVATFLGTPSSANLRGALTDENGSGVSLFDSATSPTFTTSILTGSTTFALLNTTATTVNAFGATTTLNLGVSATMILNIGGSTTASQVRFLEPSGSGTNYSAFKAVAQGADITYSLPPTVGAAGTVLTDVAGNGVLTWVAGGGSSTFSIFKPASDSTTAMQFTKADGTTVISTVDTSNARLGIGTVSPQTTLEVAGSGNQVRISNGGTRLNLTVDGTDSKFTSFNNDSGLNHPLTLVGSVIDAQGTTGFKINTGATISKWLSASAALDFANQAAIGCNDLTITVTGAATGDVVNLGIPNASVVNGTAFFSAWVSASNTVTVRYCQLVSGDPASGTFTADVIHH